MNIAWPLPFKVYMGIFLVVIVFLVCAGIVSSFYLYRDNTKFDNPLSKDATSKVSDLEWKIEKAEVVKNRDYIKQCDFPEGGNLIKVVTQAKNISDSAIEANPPLLYDKDKKEFTLIESPLLCIYKPTKFTESIQPGFYKTFTLYYFIPTDATDLKLKVSSGLESEYIDLEL